jgi:hypothetical protein
MEVVYSIHLTITKSVLLDVNVARQILEYRSVQPYLGKIESFISEWRSYLANEIKPAPNMARIGSVLL